MAETENLAQLLNRTINKGAPLYNAGKKEECWRLYFDAAKYACTVDAIVQSTVGKFLEEACDEAMVLQSRREFAEGAWVLRRCFDEILDLVGEETYWLVPKTREKGSSISNQSDDSVYYWQDEKVRSQNDFEKGQCLSDFAYILRASIMPRKHKRFGKTYADAFEATEVVEALTSLGLVQTRKTAAMKGNMLLQAGLIRSLSHPDEKSFKDGTRLYRFPALVEIKQSYEKYHVAGSHPEGADEAIYIIALKTTIDLQASTVAGISGETGEAEARPSPIKFSGVSARRLNPSARRMSQLSVEHNKGVELALFAGTIERLLDIKDRKYALRTYEQCFVGNEAVDIIVKHKMAEDRQSATHSMQELLDAGLIHHVKHEHTFEDKFFFYRFTATTDLKRAMDTIAALPNDPIGQDKVREVALVHRYKQFTGLDITDILNSFFGCEDKSGWDTVDLQNWRNNMKRWGFGRREDQDDEMVDRLSPLCLAVDPDEWDVSGDEQWESPNGILAQIAIFDQVSRSAFRGTEDAFKWDELAIRASKVAIEKGYFHSAFKSTLNQFLILLPLEHSESWEDQKLGVQLMLQLLSNVSIQDEGYSDYEIVKRLEFSKRLATAFLEHAQVIAKFKRFPHRNRPKGRTTTLEERIWLASDLVPRWAKSQQPDEANNVITLPVIPLKRLTRGR